MKLTVEIKDDKFIWDYVVGKCTESGEHPLIPEGLCHFSNMLRMCQNAYVNQHEAWIEEVKAKAYLEAHPELMKVKTNET